MAISTFYNVCGEKIVLVRGVKRMDRLINGCVKQDIDESL